MSMRSATVTTIPVTRRWQPGAGLLLGSALVLAACSPGGATSSPSPTTAAGGQGGTPTVTVTQPSGTGGGTGNGASGTSKFHVVIAGGPHPGTYDLTGAECVNGYQGKDSWGGSAESGLTGPNDIAAVVFTVVTNPVAGAVGGAGSSVTFGGTDDAVLYSMTTTTPTIDDRGTSATIVLKGPSTAANAADGTISDGGQMEVTVQCGEVARAPT